MSDKHLEAGSVALTTEVVAYLQHDGVEVAAAAGDVLARRGDAGVAFWAILDGQVYGLSFSRRLPRSSRRACCAAASGRAQSRTR
jgi:hypothetical protein